MYKMSAALRSLEDWMDLLESNHWIVSREYILSIVDNCRKNGLISIALGPASADEVEIVGENWRETISFQGCSSRVRTILDIISSDPAINTTSRILMLEGVTNFALQVRGRFPWSLGVEYLPSEELQQKWFPIMHCDIENPPFPKESFDVVISNDVLEHIGNLHVGLRGMKSVLKPGGIMIASMPFMYMQTDTVKRASILDGRIVHIMEPEYHGNPVDPEAGSLVFNVPGWDILDSCKLAGFSHAEMIFVSDFERGITGTDLAGNHVLRCVA